MQKIEDIEKRFVDENVNLFQYIMYSMITFNRSKSWQIKGVTDNEETKTLWEQYEYNFADVATEDKNQQILETIREKILNARAECSEYLDNTEKKEIPEELEHLKILAPEFGLVTYLSNEWKNESFEEYYEYLCSKTAESLKNEIDSIPNSKLYYGEFTVDDYEKVLEYARAYCFNQHIDEMRDYEIELKEFLTMFNVIDYKNSLSIFRQSFILLMTTFDAAIFDITEIVLNNHFFEFCNANEDSLKDGYKLKEIAKFGSFESLKEDIIKKILNANYASGLLKMLHEYSPESFSDDTGDFYDIICEIIARRNLHIHKRGIVDEEYFSQAKDNMYNLKIGDVAYIRSTYYLDVMAYLECLIHNLCLL